jgi:hypothetical protein
MLSSTVYAIIVDTLVSRTGSRSKKAPCIKTHFSHLSLPDEVVNAKEDPNYGNNIKWEWKDKSKSKADSNRDSYPHQLNLKKSFHIRIQRLWLVAHPKNAFAGLPFEVMVIIVVIALQWLRLIASHSVLKIVIGCCCMMFSYSAHKHAGQSHFSLLRTE